MTPDASEWTALKENSGSYSASVMYGKFLDIKYDPAHKLYS